MHLQLAVVALQACVGLYPSVKVVSVAKKLSGPIMMQEASMVEHEVEQYISVLHIFSWSRFQCHMSKKTRM